MIISLKWLADFVDVSDYMKKPEALAEILTRAGLEVENIVNKAKDFDQVVVGHILSKSKHPNADKLSVCQVSTGEGVVHQIVCGAQNHNADDKVVVALPGAVLPGNFAIKNAVVRGVESGGMLCSEKELGLAKDDAKSPGILILSTDAETGMPFSKFRGLDDITFELKVTPNRADCLSHFGLAREVACLLSKPLKKIEPQIKLTDNSTKKEVQLVVKNNDMCPRYAGRLIAGVKVGPSPAWLKLRLESVGMNSINNIVDVTNYVMLEMGQPLHAFDAQKIAGKKISVETSLAGEKFQTLDGTELTLRGEELMIRDGDRAVAMAGVIGGKNSGVSNATTEIFLEAAYFTPMVVRRGSRMHGLMTDSSLRFSRGVDPDQTLLAMDRACELIIQVAGGILYQDHHDVYPNPVRKKSIVVAIETITKRLGYEAKAELFVSFMERLGCIVESSSEGYKVLPPTFRFDLEHEMDLIEEYARLNGYEHIPESLPATYVVPANHDPFFLAQLKLTESLQAQGFRQAVNLALVGKKNEHAFIKDFSKLQALGLGMSDRPIQLLNPLSDDLNIMRSTLAFGLYRNLVSNFHQGNEFGRLFEIGSTFSTGGQKNDKGEETYIENKRLSFIAWGQNLNLWNKKEEFPFVFELKSAIDNLFRQLGYSRPQALKWKTSSDKGVVPSFIHQGQFSALQIDGISIGYAGSIHPLILNEDKIRVPVALAEIDISFLTKAVRKTNRFESLARYPTVVRDLALLMNKQLPSSDIVDEIYKCAGPLLKRVEIFDVYQGGELIKGQKSLAVRLSLQDHNATLQDSAVNQIIDTVLARLKENFSIMVR